MTQEDKDLLIKDLCGRLPYGVKVQTTYINQKSKERSDIGIDVLTTVELSMLIDGFEEHKPYLFPMSSMTEEQREEFLNIQTEERKILLNALIEYKYKKYDKIPIIAPHKQIEWLNKNHFDYRGLIEKGLAIDATGLNIY